MKFSGRGQWRDAQSRNYFELLAILAQRNLAIADPDRYTNDPTLEESYAHAVMICAEIDAATSDGLTF